MIGTVLASLALILFIGFLIWAYLPDYRRDPKDFWWTIIGMPIDLMLNMIGLGPVIRGFMKSIKDRHNKSSKS